MDAISDREKCRKPFTKLMCDISAAWPGLNFTKMVFSSMIHFIFKGHTCLVNFFNVGSKFYLVDLPGYGYVEGLGSERGTHHFVKVAEGYLKDRAGKE